DLRVELLARESIRFAEARPARGLEVGLLLAVRVVGDALDELAGGVVYDGGCRAEVVAELKEDMELAGRTRAIGERGPIVLRVAHARERHAAREEVRRLGMHIALVVVAKPLRMLEAKAGEDLRGVRWR